MNMPRQYAMNEKMMFRDAEDQDHSWLYLDFIDESEPMGCMSCMMMKVIEIFKFHEYINLSK